jgi:very-short-patch-repair endonuclease
MPKQSPTQRVSVRRLRSNQTDAERKLWVYLRNRGLSGAKFRRKSVIGDYIVGFCSLEQKLLVEIDGDQHVADVASDQKRTDVLMSKGFRVLRFRNHEVLAQLELVLEHINRELKAPSPWPSP